MIRLYLFGVPRLERDGAPVTTDTRKAIALLAYLAVTARGHTRDALAALLWGEADEQHARGALRRTLSVLRTAAGEDAIDSAGDVLSAGQGLWCDVVEFRGGLKRGQAELAAALELAQMPFMAGFNLKDAPDFEEWQFLEAEALNREVAAALSQQAEDLSGRGNYSGALEHARRLLALDTLNEEAHRLLMRLYSYSGDQVAALRQYRDCVRVLEQELAVAPLPETTELYHALRERKLAPPSRFAAPELAPPSPVQARSVAAPRALVGRTAEWSALLRRYERVESTGVCAGLEGEAGIGKTRLAEELLAHARGRGAAVATGRCYEGEAGVAYGVVIQVLRALFAQAGCADRLAALPASVLQEVARLLPELQTAGAPASPGAPDPGAAARFLDGLCHFLTGLCEGSAPTVLFFDDLHWADAASLDFISFLARRLQGHRILLLLAWRTDGSAEVERLRLLMAELERRDNGVLLHLQRLQLADVVEMMEIRNARAGAEGAAHAAADATASAERVYRESEGVPLFVAAYLDVADGAAAPGPENLPPTIRDLLAARLAPITDGERQLLQAAAVLGRTFDVDMLQATSGRSAEETLAGVERLASRGMIHEGPAVGAAVAYDFDHDKLRALVYKTTGAARRRLLHERAARAWLAAGPRRRTAPSPAALAAYHFEAAGREEEAIEQHLQAAQQAQRVYANEEAMGHYRAALALGSPDAARVHEVMGDLEALGGDYAAALSSYEAAAARLAGGSQEGARLDHKLANLYARLGDWEAAESYYTTAERALPDASSAQRAALFADWALLAHQRGDAQRAEGLIERGLQVARATGDDAALARATNILGVIQRGQGDLDAAIGSLETSAQLAQKLGDASAQAAALNNLALAHAEKGSAGRGEELLRAALTDALRRGDRHCEAAIRNNLADLLHAQGCEDEAMAQLKLAVALFAEIGLPPGKGRAEIWRLTEW